MKDLNKYHWISFKYTHLVRHKLRPQGVQLLCGCAQHRLRIAGLLFSSGQPTEQLLVVREQRGNVALQVAGALCIAGSQLGQLLVSVGPLVLGLVETQLQLGALRLGQLVLAVLMLDLGFELCKKR